MERLFSAYGVTAFSDHDEDGLADDLVVSESIAAASAEILIHLNNRYLQADLVQSPLVRRWATVGALWFLCQNRGNPVPESLSLAWERLIDDQNGTIPKIGRGLNQLPGLQLRYDSRPSFSNLRIDRRWPNSKTRVTPTNSSDAPTTLSQKKTIERAGFDL